MEKTMAVSTFCPRKATKLLVASLAVLCGCQGIHIMCSRPLNRRTMLVTAYCKCAECCGWRRAWHGGAVYTYGTRKGQVKRVGVTSGGTRAGWGTIAADTSVYPVGTIMHVPGYGYGRVEDTGRSIRGNHIDLFFETHSAARQWGSRTTSVHVWSPENS